MGRKEALEKYLKTGKIEDYEAYRAEIEGKPVDASKAILNMNNGMNDSFGVSDENANKWFGTPGIGLWRKR